MNPNCLQRSDSLVATQALHLWNDATIRQHAGHFADRLNLLSGNEASIQEIFQIAFGRSPTPVEMAACIETLDRLSDNWLNQTPKLDGTTRKEAKQRALAKLCHTILNTAEFLYLD
jgi:hypothetical protein